jgi:hypothetical protein
MCRGVELASLLANMDQAGNNRSSPQGIQQGFIKSWLEFFLLCNAHLLVVLWISKSNRLTGTNHLTKNPFHPLRGRKGQLPRYHLNLLDIAAQHTHHPDQHQGFAVTGYPCRSTLIAETQ